MIPQRKTGDWEARPGVLDGGGLGYNLYPMYTFYLFQICTTFLDYRIGLKHRGTIFRSCAMSPREEALVYFLCFGCWLLNPLLGLPREVSMCCGRILTTSSPANNLVAT
jgi:hypothetical protein